MNVLGSTTDNTYVGVVYSTCGVNYDSKMKVGTNGTAVSFIALFARANFGVEIGYPGNLTSGATETVTIARAYPTVRFVGADEQQALSQLCMEGSDIYIYDECLGMHCVACFVWACARRMEGQREA